MPQRSHRATRERNSASQSVYRFYDRDGMPIPISSEDLVFVNGLLLQPSNYFIYEDGVVLLLEEWYETDSLQAVSLKL